MDFNKLMQTMRDLDRPVSETAVQECGTPMMGGMAPPMAPTTPPHNPPTLSVNLNAQGMDDIESIMKLMTKVNPDMINQPKAAAIEPMGMPSLTPPGPSISSIGDLGNLDSGPLKMLPDFDKGNDDMPGGEMDGDPVASIQKAMGDQDGDGDHDMDDHEAEKDNDNEPVEKDPIDKDGEEDGEADNDKEKEGALGALAGGAIGAVAGGPLGALTGAAAGDSLTDPDGDEEEQEEAWANEPDTEVKSIDYMNNQLAGGMNKPKGTHPKVAGGDNPMQKMEGMDLRSQIRADLQRRLAEAKGAK